MHTDLSGLNLRVVPKTPLFRELAGLDVDREPIVAWWRDILEDGFVRWADGAVRPCQDAIGKDELYANYTGWSERNGAAARTSMLRKDQWGKRLKELVGGSLKSERWMRGGTRDWIFLLPDHEACCVVFEKQFRCTLDRPPASPVLAAVI